MEALRTLRTGAILAVTGVWLLVGQTAHAALSVDQWDNVTGNNAYDISGQFEMQISGSGQSLTLEFIKTGSMLFSVTAIYFDAPPPGNIDLPSPYMSLQSIENGSGVKFDDKLSPPNLPGWSTIDFAVTSGADSQGSPKGINKTGEHLTLRFLLNPAISVDSVVAALQTTVYGDRFRIGLHVQSLPDGDSDSFVSVAVPEPTTFLAAALLLLPFGLSTLRRRGQRSSR